MNEQLIYNLLQFQVLFVKNLLDMEHGYFN